MKPIDLKDAEIIGYNKSGSQLRVHIHTCDVKGTGYFNTLLAILFPMKEKET